MRKLKTAYVLILSFIDFAANIPLQQCYSRTSRFLMEGDGENQYIELASAPIEVNVSFIINCNEHRTEFRLFWCFVFVFFPFPFYLTSYGATYIVTLCFRKVPFKQGNSLPNCKSMHSEMMLSFMKPNEKL